MNVSGNPIFIEDLLDHPLFSGLSTHMVEQVAAGGRITDLERGNRVISRGDLLDGIFAVLNGRLKIYAISCDGKERVIRILQTGESFGEAIMFNKLPSPVFVDTLTSARIGYFPRPVISAALLVDHEFVRSMLSSMSVIMRQLIEDIEICCTQNASLRIMTYLLREADAGLPPHTVVQLAAPKAIVASTLNLSAETFSRELRRLQEKGMVEVCRRTIHLRDKKAMVACCAGENV